MLERDFAKEEKRYVSFFNVFSVFMKYFCLTRKKRRGRRAPLMVKKTV